MVRKRGVRVTILVEDKLLERFAREVLLKLGFHHRELRVVTSRVGRGSAKQWVEQQYPIEVQAYRRKANYQQIAVLVGSDADELSVERRHQQLASSLESSSLRGRGDDEHIALWIPKWHIETWILHLSGEQVDENTDCKNRLKRVQVQFSHLGDEFVARYRATDKKSYGMLPALNTAIAETGRLDF